MTPLKFEAQNVSLGADLIFLLVADLSEDCDVLLVFDLGILETAGEATLLRLSPTFVGPLLF